MTVSIDASRTCSACHRVLPATSEFFSKNGKYLHSHCKACVNAHTLRWAADNKERITSNNAKWRAANRSRYQDKNIEWHKNNIVKSRDISRRGYLRRKHGITPEELETMVHSQGHVCANPGCDAAVIAGGVSSHIDHNHSTMKIRGVLCSCCNQALGLLHESHSRILGLDIYITMHEKT